MGVGASLGVVVAFGRIIAPDVLDPPADGEPSFLSAATLAWRGAGRTGDPRRRPDDGGLCHGARGGPRHRTRLTTAGRSRSATTRRPPSCAPASAGSARRCSSRCSSRARGVAGARAQSGEPTYAAKLTPDELRLDFSRSAVECRPSRARRATPGRPTAAGGSSSYAARPFADAEAPGSAGAARGARSRHGRGRAASSSTVQSEGRGPLSFAAWAAGAQSGSRGGPRRLTTARARPGR